MSEELVLRFRDTPARQRDPDAGLPDIRGRRAECEACAFYLEHADGPRQRSITSDERLKMPYPGRGLTLVDVEQTVQLIARGIRTLSAPWRGPVVVALGWSVGPGLLREAHPRDGGPPYLERAGFPLELPPGLTKHSLLARGRDLREELIALGIIVRSAHRSLEAEDLPASARSFTREERMQLGMDVESPLLGWEAIAEFLGVSKATVRRYAELGLPYAQPGPHRKVRAYPSALRAWDGAQKKAS